MAVAVRTGWNVEPLRRQRVARIVKVLFLMFCFTMRPLFSLSLSLSVGWSVARSFGRSVGLPCGIRFVCFHPSFPSLTIEERRRLLVRSFVHSFIFFVFAFCFLCLEIIFFFSFDANKKKRTEQE